MKPITPDELSKPVIPDEVIDEFNKAVRANYRNGKAVVKSKDIVPLIAKRMKRTEEFVYDSGWLDIENVFMDAGWKVKYDQPAYCEELFDPYFEFTKRTFGRST